MEEQITQTPPEPTIPQVPVETKKKSKLPIIAISLVVISLIAIAGVMFGMQIEKRKVKVWVEPPLTEITPEPANNTPQVFTETITFKPTGTVDETSNWKTYIDGVAKFEIKYPSNWTYAVKAKTTTYSPPDQPNLKSYSGTVSFIGTEGQVDIIFGDGFGGGTCQEMKGPNAKLVNIKIGNDTIPLCNYNEMGKTYFASPFGDAGGPITPNASYNFTFSFLESFLQSKDLILKILSTFRFTNQ